MKNILLVFLTILLTTALLSSCTQRDNSPEGSLKEFIEARIGKVVTRKFVLERVSGKMKDNIEQMNDEDFLKFSDLRNMKRNSFKIVSKSCQENKCFLTYSLGYKTGDEFSSEVKKIAELVEYDGSWYIEDISNIKTYHEAIAPINPLDE